jgi:hypothetical protein
MRTICILLVLVLDSVILDVEKSLFLTVYVKLKIDVNSVFVMPNELVTRERERLHCIMYSLLR